MHLYCTALVLLLLLVLVYRISGSLLFPATIFAGVWAATIGTLALVQDSFYTLTMQTLAIYVVGALAFCAGCFLLMTALPQDFKTYEPSERRRRNTRVLLDIAFAVAIVAFPFYVRWVTDPIGGLGAPNLLALIRFANLENAGRGGGFSLMNNLPLLARFVAFAMILENDTSKGRRLRAYLSSILAVFYGLLTGSKEILITIVIVAFFADAMKRGRLNWKGAVALALIVPLMFAGGLLFVNYWWQTSYVDVTELLPDVVWTVELYWLSGTVAFDQVVQHPAAFVSRQNVSRIFLEAANGVGAKIDLPDLNAEFTKVSPHQWTADMNVYTVYFSYFKDPGWLGMIALMLVAGLGSTFVYKLALAKHPIAVVLYGLLARAIILTFHGEHFFYGLNQYAKIAIFFLLIYYTPLLVSAARQHTAEPA